ncbi:hypothetical protein [Flavobacterium sp. UBA4197]|uniref:hypothetical protein n=1 Tax=Flavobacterium sp. UBA4197 TaxID=1946546 RepID=UPI00257AE78B|nr:hypothetical protein [Flavobacterium sp. UBA4197]
MKSKKLIVFNLFLLFFILSCENNFNYQKVKIDSKNKTIEILSSDFVFDSITIENHKKTFYNAKLVDKSQGTNLLLINDFSKKGYRISKSDFDDMCNQKYENNLTNFDIYIRHKDYKSESIFEDRDKIQRFNIAYLPCDSQIIIIDAIRRH